MPLKMTDTSWRFVNDRDWVEHFRKWPPVIVSCAITGGMQGKEANPNLPETPEEQADSTYGAYKAGASSVHIHARDPKNYYATASPSGEDYYKVNKLVREQCPDIIICDTAAGGIGLSREQRIDSVVHGHPEMASLDVGWLGMRMLMKKRPAPLKGRDEDVLYEGAMDFGFSINEYWAKMMRENKVKAELEVFSSQSWWYVDNLINQNLIDQPYWCQLVFGQVGACSLPTPMAAMAMIADMPDNSMFSAIGTGPLQLPIIVQSLLMGGHIRVGMEDNVYYRRGELAKSNAQFVERSVRICHELNRDIATPAQAREMLGISPTPSKYP